MMLREYAAQLRAMGAGYVPKSVGRHVPVRFAFLINDVDVSTASGAVWEGDVRTLPDAGGAVVGAFTITAVVQGVDTLVTVTMAAPAAIEAFPPANSTGEAAQLFYDIHLTPSGGTKQVIFGGDFNVIAGVVQDFTGYEDPAVASVSAFMLTLLDDVDAATARATLGVGAGAGDMVGANNLSDVANAGTARANLSAASSSQTGEQISGFMAAPSNKDYIIALKMAHGGTITEATTKSVSGTCTATFKVNSTALGGTANSVSSSEQSQSHASANTFVAGDDIVLTVSSNTSCTDMSFTLKYTRTLA